LGTNLFTGFDVPDSHGSTATNIASEEIPPVELNSEDIHSGHKVHLKNGQTLKIHFPFNSGFFTTEEYLINAI